MNRYYANWSYGYTLQPSSEATRGAYQMSYGGGAGSQQSQGQGASNWSQIKGKILIYFILL